MDLALSEWLALLVRWAHVVVGAAWIGTSFYFNWLNDTIRKPDTPEAGVAGDLWAIHGGGFYRIAKYDVDAEPIPESLHWFKWEAYSTWLTGMGLLVLVYYVGASVYMVDRDVADISASQAIGIGVGTLVGGWLVYDLLCRTALVTRERAFALVGVLLVAAASFALSRVLSGRAAFMHIGAMLGTIMAGNVFRVIIPAQHALVRARKEARAPDVAVATHAGLRSRHNNYLALPVLFVMVSNHYPLTFGSRWSWLVLTGITVAGMAVRHWFNVRGRRTNGAWLLGGATVVLALTMLVTAAGRAPRQAALVTGTMREGTPSVPFSTARAVMDQRCRTCHSAAPTNTTFTAAPLGVMFDTPEQIVSMAQRIHVRAVEQRTMPMGNVTGMTDAERALLGAWIRDGARLR